MLFTVPTIGRFTEIMLFSGFKNPYKKIRVTRKLESIHEQDFVEWKNYGSKTRVREHSSLCPETSTKNDVQEYHLWQTTMNANGKETMIREVCDMVGRAF